MRKQFVLLFLLALVAVACASQPQGQRLRLKNTGTVPIAELQVRFPDEQVAFGTLAPGAVTEYKTFAKGVYRYAAYEYSMNGTTQHQPVTDWVGEAPMEGNSFTYSLAFDASPQPVQLLNVERDE